MILAAIPPAASTLGWICAVQLIVAGVFSWFYFKRRSAREVPFDGRTDLLVADLISVFIAFDNVPRLVADIVWSPLWLAALFSCRFAWGSALGLYWTGAQAKFAVARHSVAHLGFLISAIGLGRLISPAWPWSSLVLGCAVYITLVLARLVWRQVLWRRFTPTPAEELRWMLLLATALILTHAWFAPGLVGTGDAQLYFETLQDFLNQLRAGIWPPWVSQSEVAPFGAVFPFRLATYHYYFCALLDVLTGRQLTTFGLQHLSIILSFIAGGWACYAVLRRLCPGHPWIACALAALYLASPAWLGPLIGFTMIFTMMALPYVPLALAGAWPDFGAKTKSHAIGHGAALAAAWHAHPPVGFWVSVTVALAQIIAGIVVRPGWKTLGRQTLAWLVCVILCSGLWYSTLSLHYSQSQAGAPSMAPLIMAIMREAFPATILPASSGAQGFPDIQLGYSLWLVTLIALAVAVRERRKIVVWLIPALLLSVLVLPFPWITERLWKSLPGSVLAISGTWPVQRLLGPLAGVAVIAGMFALANQSARSTRWRTRIAVLLASMLIWSGIEAAKYLRRSHATVLPPALSLHLSRPEHRPLLINWLAFHDYPIPPIYVGGKFFDARLFNRVWTEDRQRILADNYESVLAPPGPAFITAAAEPLAERIWRILPAFEFESGKYYLLELTPTPQTAPGTLIVSAIEFQRTETALQPGGPAVILPLRATTTGTKTAEMVYLPTDPALAAKAIPAFLKYRLIPYDPAALPIRIDQFAPYRATLNLAQPGWLETHRFFTSGYRAKVNGEPAEVAKSSDNRAMIRVPAGTGQVQLDYVGSPLLRASYGLMGAGWLILGVWGCALLWRRMVVDHNGTSHVS